ncbi:MAG: glycosyltransferase [Pseudomonadota bacterium]
MQKNHNKKNLISIIIPAHNEERVIGRCLTTLLQNLNPEEADIIVVCNGCTDQTAKVVQSTAREIQLLETPVASKANALNLGDEHANGFPRFYIDADIMISGEDVKKLAQALKKDSLLAASPVMKMELKERPWVIKAFYQIWCRLPYVTQGTIGGGVYALSKKGKERFEKFPEITADDAFIRFLFSPSERGVVRSAAVTVFPPRCLSDLIRIRIRNDFGNYELKKTFPELAARYDESNIGGTFFSLFKKISLWPALLVYTSISIYSRLGGMCKFWFGDRQYWNRDESSRI